MRTRRTAAAIAMVVLALGVGIGVAGVAGATPSTPATDTPAVCARLQARAARVPAFQQRIRDRIDTLEARVAAVRDDTRRARVAAQVQTRTDRLQRLTDALSEQVAAAQRLCGDHVV